MCRGAKFTTPNVFLACRSFELKTIEAQKHSGRSLDLLLLKNFRQKVCSKNRASTRDIHKIRGAVWWEKLGQCLEIRVNSCVPLSLPACLLSRSVVYDSLRPHGLQPTRLLCPQDLPGKNTGVGCHFLLQGIFLTQGSNPGLLNRRQTLPSEPGKPPLSLQDPENICLPNLCLPNLCFPSSCELPSSPLKSQTTIPKSFFIFS